MDRCPDVIVTPHHGKIQEKGKDFYCQFNIIIAGLDNIKFSIELLIGVQLVKKKSKIL